MLSLLKHLFTGRVFFGTQEQLTNALEDLTNIKGLVFSMRGVPSIDDSAIHELELLVDHFRSLGTTIVFSGVQENVKATMERAGFLERIGIEWFVWDTIIAIKKLDDNLNIIDIPEK